MVKKETYCVPYAPKCKVYLCFPLLNREVEAFFDTRLSLRENEILLKMILPFDCSANEWLFMEPQSRCFLSKHIPLGELYAGEYLKLVIY